MIKLGITPHAGNIPADLLYSGIQLFLPAPRDNSLAVANAIPEAAPVMTATFPSSFFGISVSPAVALSPL